MPIRQGLVNLKKRFIGSSEVQFVYLGTTLLYKSITQFVTDFVARVSADGGTTESTTNVNTLMQDLRNKDVFEDATFVMIPSGTKSGKVYSQVPNKKIDSTLVVNGEFDTDTIWNKQSGVTISNGALNLNSPSLDSSTIQSIVLTNNQTYELTYTISNYISGVVRVIIYAQGQVGISTQRSSNGTFTELVTLASGGSFINFLYIQSRAANSILSIDNISLKEQSQGDLTFTRASTKTRVNSSDLIENVASEVAAIDYSTGSPTLLLEPQRTNLLLRSEEFDNAYWQKLNTTINPNQLISPKNSLDTDLFIEDSLNTTHQCRISSFTVLSGQTYTLSLFVKKTSPLRNLRLVVFEAGFSRSATLNLDVQSNILQSTAGAMAISSRLVNYSNGYVRHEMTFSTTTTLLDQIVIHLTNSTFNLTYQGDGISNVAVFGVQMEQGSYATSYIPTVATTVTRLADSFTRNNVFTNGLISAQGGTWFVELKNNIILTRSADSNGIFLDTNTTTLTNGFNIKNDGTNSRLSINKTVASTTTPLYTTTTDLVKLAIKWNGTTADIFQNGVKVVTATSFTPTNMEFLNSLNADVNKSISQMALYPKPLTDTECILLTTL